MSKRKKWLLILTGAVCMIVIWAGLVRHVLKCYQEMMCLANVHQIGLSMIAYAADHDSQYPPSFGVLLKEGYLGRPSFFICPASEDRVPDNFPRDKEWDDPTNPFEHKDLTTLNRVDDCGSYVMVKGLIHDSREGIVILHEKDGAHAGRSRTCYFDDGVAKTLPEAEFQEHMKAQKAKLREMGEKREDER